MAIYFVDTSALVKRYIDEVGSKWILDVVDPALGNEIFVAATGEGLIVENPCNHV